MTNHIRTCAACRAALAREERFAAELRRDLPALGQPRPAQLAQVWSGVMTELAAGAVGARSMPHRRPVGPWLSGLSMALAIVLLVMVALPLMTAGEWRVEAAPQQPRPISTASPTPGATDTVSAAPVQPSPAIPHATVALALMGGESEAGAVGATPAPMPELTVSPAGGGR